MEWSLIYWEIEVRWKLLEKVFFSLLPAFQLLLLEKLRNFEINFWYLYGNFVQLLTIDVIANAYNYVKLFFINETASRASSFLFIALDSLLFSMLMRDRLSVKVIKILGHLLTGILSCFLAAFKVNLLSIIHVCCS